jgi:hypothetical protein
MEYEKIIRRGRVYYIKKSLLVRYDINLLSTRQFISLADAVADEIDKDTVKQLDYKFNINSFR